MTDNNHLTGLDEQLEAEEILQSTEDASGTLLRNVALSQLRPDWLNPRFPPGAEREFQSDGDVYAYIDKKFDAVAIAESMARHGFFPTEPLIVIPQDVDTVVSGPHADVKADQGRRYIVLEGNRRLTALQGLTQAKVRDRMQDPRWATLQLAKPMPSLIPVLVAQSRAEVAPILGYRHVTGIAPWDPYQQARYVASLIDDGDELMASDVAQLIGRDLSEVRSFYRNYSIVEQARDMFGLEDVDRIVDEFGVWTRALTSVGIRDYIDAPSPRDVREREYPLPEDKALALSNIVTWIFGSPRKSAQEVGASRQTRDGRVINDSRQLTRFGKALANPQGREVLERGGSLADAERAALNKRVRFMAAMDEAVEALKRAEASVTSEVLADAGEQIKAIRGHLAAIEASA